MPEPSNRVLHEDVVIRGRSHFQALLDPLVATGTHSTQLWINPSGQASYFFDSDQGVVYDDGQQRPNTPPDHTVSGGGPFSSFLESTWTSPPWAGWSERLTFTRGLPQPLPE